MAGGYILIDRGFSDKIVAAETFEYSGAYDYISKVVNTGKLPIIETTETVNSPIATIIGKIFESYYISVPGSTAHFTVSPESPNTVTYTIGG